MTFEQRLLRLVEKPDGKTDNRGALARLHVDRLHRELDSHAIPHEGGPKKSRILLDECNHRLFEPS